MFVEECTFFQAHQSKAMVSRPHSSTNSPLTSLHVIQMLSLNTSCPLKISSKNSFLLIRVSNNFFLDLLSSKHDGIDPERTTYDPLVSPFRSRPPSSQREPNKGNCSGVQSSAPHLPSCDTALTTVNGPAPVPPGLIFSLARLFSLCYRLRPYLLADPFSADCVPRPPLIRLAALRFWLSSRRLRSTTPRR